MEKRILVGDLDIQVVEGILYMDGIKRTRVKQVGLYCRRRFKLGIMKSCQGLDILKH